MLKILALFLSLWGIALAMPASAQDIQRQQPSVACVAEVSAYYRVPDSIPWLLKSIEGGDLGSVSLNKNGSKDYGPFQVNSVQLDDIVHLTRLSRAEVIEMLRWDGCWSAGIATWVYAKCMSLEHNDIWRAIGCYHSPYNPGLKSAYMKRAAKRILELCGPEIFDNTQGIVSCPALTDARPPGRNRREG